LSYFSGRVATALGRASRRWLHDATAGGGPAADLRSHALPPINTRLLAPPQLAFIRM
jgi:hypothetical protein